MFWDRIKRLGELYWLSERSGISLEKAIGVVGTRECTAEGAVMAYEIGRALSEKYVVVTGLARGIDFHAALGALERGVVVGVRPYLFPIDYVNNEMLGEMLRKGGIAARNLNKINDKRWLGREFYERNRIIEKLSKAIVVVEARNRPHAGSMHQISATKRKAVFVWYNDAEQEEELLSGYERYVESGAVSFKSVSELLQKLEAVMNG